MVSFSCEACGDVLTKKKLDPHRNQCRGASFTCIDCMVHFQGTNYRSHTTCMTEAQKYEGALYKEKPAKNQNGRKNQQPKQNTRPTPNHRPPYVEDVPDAENPKANIAPPPAPTPPSSGSAKSTAPTVATTEKPVNVFDFLVPGDTPNASKVSLANPKEQMEMVAHAPSVFEQGKAVARVEGGDDDMNSYDMDYEENGYSYGAGPINPSPYENKASAYSMEFVTPAPKKKDRREKQGTSEKKRKRGQADKLDSEGADLVDTPMMDAPSSVQNHPGTPMLRHSGLTGGLNRMLRSPSVEGEDQHDHPRRQYQDPSSPIKRTRRSDKESNGSDAIANTSMKNRAERLVSSMFGGSSVVSTASGGSNEAPKGIIRSKKNNGESRKSKRKTSAQTADGDRPSQRLKQIEYHDERAYSPRDHEMVVYRQPNVPDAVQREMAHHFLSLVNKGPESSRGLSINKTLKRFHRDFTDEYDDRGRDGRSRADREQRTDDEKELWRTLRLRRNDRGEVVVFF